MGTKHITFLLLGMLTLTGVVACGASTVEPTVTRPTASADVKVAYLTDWTASRDPNGTAYKVRVVKYNDDCFLETVRNAGKSSDSHALTPTSCPS